MHELEMFNGGFDISTVNSKSLLGNLPEPGFTLRPWIPKDESQVAPVGE